MWDFQYITHLSNRPVSRLSVPFRLFILNYLLTQTTLDWYKSSIKYTTYNLDSLIWLLCWWCRCWNDFKITLCLKIEISWHDTIRTRAWLINMFFFLQNKLIYDWLAIRYGKINWFSGNYRRKFRLQYPMKLSILPRWICR